MTADFIPPGPHKFELAGLGRAPFRFVGVFENLFAIPGQPARPGGSCDYCAASIRNEFHVRSADGKTFKVGCDCIAKVGDQGLVKQYKTSPEFRKFKRDREKLKADAILSELKALLESQASALAALPHPLAFTDRKTGKPLTKLDWAMRMFDICGRAGRVKLLRDLKS